MQNSTQRHTTAGTHPDGHLLEELVALGGPEASGGRDERGLDGAALLHHEPVGERLARDDAAPGGHLRLRSMNEWVHEHAREESGRVRSRTNLSDQQQRTHRCGVAARHDALPERHVQGAALLLLVLPAGPIAAPEARSQLLHRRRVAPPHGWLARLG